MAANTTMRVTELDFDSIKNNLKDFLRSQSQFQDFDFEGSGMNVLLDILAYNTHYNAYYLNMLANEMFLDTSKLRESTVSHAKLINYVPESNHGSEAKVNISITPTEEEDGFPFGPVNELTIQKYSRFLGASVDGINYPFVAINSNTAYKDSNGTFQFSNIVLKQGEVITRQFPVTSSNPKRRFELSSANIDTDTLIVTVQQSASNTDFTPYKLVSDITEINKDSKVYFLEENGNGNYTIYFGDNVIGKSPSDGNIITCTYLDVAGSVTNRINAFSIIDRPLDYDNVVVTSTGPAYSGSEKETIEQIRYRAPYYYTAQNRAVTTTDYETLLTKDYPNIDAVSIWGGDENVPPVYGKVFLSLKTKDNFFLSVLEKENIKDNLIKTRSVLTVFPEIVDPEYKFVLVRGRVYFNSSVTSLTAEQIRAFVKAAIEDYSDENLNRFKSTFIKSKMQNYIEASDSSITSTDLSILMQKRISLTLNQTRDYIVDFGVPIRKGDFKTAFSTYPAVGVLDGNLVQRRVFFEEVPSIASGISRVEIQNGGINYSVPPTVTITGDGTGATAEAKVLGGKISEIVITNKGSNYSRAFISLSGGSGNGAILKPILESRISQLRTYYLIDEQEDVKRKGEKVFVNNQAGTIDYDSGIVRFDKLTPLEVVKNEFYDPEILSINVPVDTEVINSVRNDIVIVDVDDPLAIQVEVIAE